MAKSRRGSRGRKRLDPAHRVAATVLVTRQTHRRLAVLCETGTGERLGDVVSRALDVLESKKRKGKNA